MEPTEHLFTYGALRVPETQRALFGRVPGSREEVLSGFRLDHRAHPGPHEGPLARWRALRATGDPLDKVVGLVLQVTETELDAADDFEMMEFARREVVVDSGLRVWVYVVA